MKYKWARRRWHANRGWQMGGLFGGRQLCTLFSSFSLAFFNLYIWVQIHSPKPWPPPLPWTPGQGLMLMLGVGDGRSVCTRTHTQTGVRSLCLVTLSQLNVDSTGIHQQKQVCSQVLEIPNLKTLLLHNRLLWGVLFFSFYAGQLQVDWQAHRMELWALPGLLCCWNQLPAKTLAC